MASATQVNRQWRLKSRPTGLIKTDNFELVSQPIPVPEDGQLLIRSVYLSLDPAMRGWLIDRPSYVPPVQIGEIMRGWQSESWRNLGDQQDFPGGTLFRCCVRLVRVLQCETLAKWDRQLP